MTDLRSLTNEQLMALRDARSNGQGGPMQASATGDGDLASQLGYGLVEGAASIPGMVGDLSEYGARGIDRATRAIGGVVGAHIEPRPDQPTRFGTREILDAIQPMTGEMPAPQSTAGQYMRTIGQFGAGAAMPGGMARRVVGGVLAPALTSETAGQIAPEGYETAARLAGGVGGGVAGATRMPVMGAGNRANAALGDMVTPQTQARLAELGPDAFMFEGNPTLMQTAQGVVQRPGQASEQLRTAVTDRHQHAGQRIRTDIDTTLGPAEVPSQVIERIKADKAALGPEFDAAVRGATSSVHVKPLLAHLARQIETNSGGPQAALKKIQGFLTDTGSDILSVEKALNVRRAIDDLAEQLKARGETNALRLVGEARKGLDGMLGIASPALKRVDAKFAELSKQEEALTRGGMLLDVGKEAVPPADVAAGIANMSAGERAMQRTGMRADLERRINTKLHDVNALRREMQSGNSWNPQKLEIVFGRAEAERIMRSADREAAFREAYNGIAGNSLTAPRQAAAEATRLQGIGPLTPEMVGAGTAAVLTGNPVAALATGAGVGGAKRLADAFLAGGQRRFDKALVDRLGAQGSNRDRIVQELMAAPARRGQNLTREMLLRALMGAQGGSVPARSE